MNADTEKKLRAFLLTGMSQAEIAKQLRVTPAYVSAAMLKLGLRARSLSAEQLYLAEQARLRNTSVEKLRSDLLHLICADRLIPAIMDDEPVLR
jgi:transcriptional regulator with XRE-family HTH domain